MTMATLVMMTKIMIKVMIKMMMMMMTNPAASIPMLATIMADPGDCKRSTTNPVNIMMILMSMMLTITMIISMTMMMTMMMNMMIFYEFDDLYEEKDKSGHPWIKENWLLHKRVRSKKI